LSEPRGTIAAPLKTELFSSCPPAATNPLTSRAFASVLMLLTVASCGDSGIQSPILSPGWGVPETLGTTGSLGSLAGDGNGDGVVAWLPLNGPDLPTSVVARRFARATGWAPLATVVASGSSSLGQEVGAMDSSGTAIVLWSDTDGLFASTSNGGNWDSPSLISTADSFSNVSFPIPALALSAPGSALAIWTNPVTGVYANRLTPALGWGSPTTVRSTGFADRGAPGLAVTSTGFALAAWDEGATQIWWSTFDPNHGWAVAQRLQLTDSSTPVYGVVAALNAAGEGVLAWIQGSLVFASHYTIAGGPEPPEVLGRGAPNGLAIDSAGNAVAVLTQPGVLGAGLIVRVYRSGQGWDATPIVASKDANVLGALSMDSLGNSWLVWADSAGSVWAARYLSNQGLQPPQLLDTAGGVLEVFPEVVADTDGSAIAIWHERPPGLTVFNIRAARYVAPQRPQ
jgi:hypothetical protein